MDIKTKTRTVRWRRHKGFFTFHLIDQCSPWYSLIGYYNLEIVSNWSFSPFMFYLYSWCWNSHHSKKAVWWGEASSDWFLLFHFLSSLLAMRQNSLKCLVFNVLKWFLTTLLFLFRLRYFSCQLFSKTNHHNQSVCSLQWCVCNNNPNLFNYIWEWKMTTLIFSEATCKW